MIVVSDTTPLITLMKVGRLSILNSLFGEVRIPDYWRSRGLLPLLLQ